MRHFVSQGFKIRPADMHKTGIISGFETDVLTAIQGIV
jgi:hypothetical protein